jgi:hypothetical protein
MNREIFWKCLINAKTFTITIVAGQLSGYNSREYSFPSTQCQEGFGNPLAKQLINEPFIEVAYTL